MFPTQPKPKQSTALELKSEEATPFRSYYAANFRTIKPSAMENLYAKFSVQRGAPPAQVELKERSHSKLVKMSNEELITGYEHEIMKLSEELARLKASVSA